MRTGLREATEEDLDSLTRLEASCFPDPWPRESLQHEFQSTTARLFVTGHPRVLAYACFQVVLDEAELLRLATAPEARRRGLGAALIDYGIQHLVQEGVRRLFLEVREDNHAARTLYEGLEFHLEGRRDAYYRDGENALLYARKCGPDRPPLA